MGQGFNKNFSRSVAKAAKWPLTGFFILVFSLLLIMSGCFYLIANDVNKLRSTTCSDGWIHCAGKALSEAQKDFNKGLDDGTKTD